MFWLIDGFILAVTYEQHAEVGGKSRRLYAHVQGQCASSYKSSLEDKQFIIIYRDKVYSKIRHVAKGLNLGTIKFPTEVSDKISLENYMPKKC